MAAHRPAGHVDPDYSPAPNRFWADGHGRAWRVWLEPPARHQRRRGERRPILSFVPLGQDGRAQILRVAEHTSLLDLTDAELADLLREAADPD